MLMKKHFTFFLFAVLLYMVPQLSNAQAVNANAEVFWSFGLGTANQVATYSNGTDVYFNQDYVAVGENLNLLDFRTSNGVTFTRFQPLVKSGAPSETHMVSFGIRPKAGLKFKPTSIAITSQRYGTDGGRIVAKWKSGDGTETSVLSEITPARDNSGGVTNTVIDLTGLSIPLVSGEGVLQIYIYNLDNTKQIGLANIKVEGQVSGEIVNVNSYTITTEVVPSQAGTISSNPVGNTFDEGTEITLTATRSFGHAFSHWANNDNQVVSSENPYKFTLNANTSLKAVFTSIETYELMLDVDGGAKPYMVTISPAPTIREGKKCTKQEQMYC